MNETKIYQAINAVSQKINEISKRLDNFTSMKHKENADKISEDELGIVDVADIISEQNEAILELADIVDDLVSNLNGKEE
jgi:hypothetical protein